MQVNEAINGELKKIYVVDECRTHDYSLYKSTRVNACDTIPLGIHKFTNIASDS